MYFNNLYCLLKDGRKMVCWSDNECEETMSVFPESDLEFYDAEFQSFETVPYSDVVRTDRNRIAAYL